MGLQHTDILASSGQIRLDADQLIHGLILNQARLPPFGTRLTDPEIFSEVAEAHSETLADVLEFLRCEEIVPLAVGVRARDGIGIRLCAGQYLESTTIAHHRFRTDRYLFASDVSRDFDDLAHHLALFTLKTLHNSSLSIPYRGGW